MWKYGTIYPDGSDSLAWSISQQQEGEEPAQKEYSTTQ